MIDATLFVLGLFVLLAVGFKVGYEEGEKSKNEAFPKMTPIKGIETRAERLGQVKMTFTTDSWQDGAKMITLIHCLVPFTGDDGKFRSLHSKSITPIGKGCYRLEFETMPYTIPEISPEK